MANISKAKAAEIAAKEARDTYALGVANASKRISAAKSAKLATSSLGAGMSAINIAKEVVAFIGSEKPATPKYGALYNTARLAYMAGRIAASHRGNGANGDDDDCVAHGRLVLDSCAFDVAKMPAKATRKRTEPEQLWYNAARQAWSSLCKGADIATPNSNGGTGRGVSKPNSPKKTPLELAKAEATKAKAEATRVVNKFGPPKIVDKESAETYFERMAVTMAAYLDNAQAKTKGAIAPAYASAVQDYLAAIKAAGK